MPRRGPGPAAARRRMNGATERCLDSESSLPDQLAGGSPILFPSSSQLSLASQQHSAAREDIPYHIRQPEPRKWRTRSLPQLQQTGRHVGSPPSGTRRRAASGRAGNKTRGSCWDPRAVRLRQASGKTLPQAISHLLAVYLF